MHFLSDILTQYALDSIVNCKTRLVKRARQPLFLMYVVGSLIFTSGHYKITHRDFKMDGGLQALEPNQEITLITSLQNLFIMIHSLNRGVAGRNRVQNIP